MTVGKADDTCFNALNPRNAVSPQRTAHRNALAKENETYVQKLVVEMGCKGFVYLHPTPCLIPAFWVILTKFNMHTPQNLTTINTGVKNDELFWCILRL
ncbi:hypothetical protein LC593_12365 [Nostoc sp. CHAB 5844]|nr:hypothetical protein [Nostoc sp. CHAB 5844]